MLPVILRAFEIVAVNLDTFAQTGELKKRILFPLLQTSPKCGTKKQPSTGEKMCKEVTLRKICRISINATFCNTRKGACF